MDGLTMYKNIILIVIALLILLTINSYADFKKTTRIPQFSNEEVSIWKTIIYPDKEQVLKMHRHDHNRVVIALNSGLLKITNNKGKVHYFKLEKDHAYYLAKDITDELHVDENISHHPIKVLVIELKK
jgi:hypothetical protein